MVLVALLVLACTAKAQSQDDFEAFRRQARSNYDAFKSQTQQEYADFRKRANEEYARFMQEAWQQMRVIKGEEPPAKPKPPRPAIAVPDRIPDAQPVPYAEVVPKPRKVAPPTLPNIPEPAPTAPTLQVNLYNTPCNVHAGKNLRLTLASVDEKGAAAAWKQLSDERYDGLLHDCLEQRQALHLCDWGYIELTQQVSRSLMGGAGNEAVLLQMYLLTQSGMKVRIAKGDGHFALLVPFTDDIYSYSYVTIDGQKYYLIDKTIKNDIAVCNVGFPKEHVADIRMAEMPRLASQTQNRHVAARKFATMQADVQVNRGLIEFLNNYPVSSAWNHCANASLSPGLKASLYPMLRTQLQGKSQKKAAAMLLDFVQTAFEYKTDQEQFGYERPLFGDESFYYPYNDCEDRSILYSILVCELLGLEVVLLNYPGHLATAVCFTEGEVTGDYLTIQDKRYVVCDPTYINAGVGECMPQFKSAKAKVVML